MSLHLKSIRVYFVQVPLRFTVEHALAARRSNITGFLVLTARDGTMGVGEFLAREYLMGETPDDIVRYLQTIAPLLASAPMDNPIELLRRLWQSSDDIPGKYGALGALDLALLDLWGKVTRTPVAGLLALSAPDRTRTFSYSAVYPFASGLKLTALHLGYARLLGITDLKVKGSGDLDRDLDYVGRIRRAFPYPVTIRLDLNGSLSPANAEAYFARLLETGVTWFEQPFPADDWDSSARFQSQYRSRVVLCADESVCTCADLERAIRTRAFDAVNIRIAKHGGLLASLQIYERAVAAGLKLQLGALVGETSVLSFAGLHFAAAVPPLLHYEGCFGKYLVRWDLIQPALTFSRRGHVSAQQLPVAGLVPAFGMERLERAALSSTQLV